MNYKNILPVVLAIIFTLILTPSRYAQSISVEVENCKSSNAVLFSLEGENRTKIDSTLFQNGTFRFPLDNKRQGFYLIELDNRHSITFINDGKNISLKTDFNNLFDSLKVIASESNKLYYEFVRANKSYKTKTELLRLILQRYPKGDDYLIATQKKLNEIETAYLTFVNVESQKEPDSFIARYIHSAQLPVPDALAPYEKQLKYLKSHALDNVDFTDEEMIYSDLFTNKAIEYLTYYRNPQLPKGALEKEFIKAVDSLLARAKVNEAVYRHLTEYLVDGFTKFGFDAIVNYIVENYVIKDDLCLDAKLESSIQKRIDQAKYLKIGNIAPNIILPDTNGNKIDLSSINAEKTLVVFYASWCPHCKDKMPELVKLYNNQKTKRIEIFAVSIDEKREDWINFIKKHNMNWLNVSDLKGWSGKPATDYFIYATPTFFLIDNDRKIISKPLTDNELKTLFQTE